MQTESFADCSGRFVTFIANNGFPSRLRWVGVDDVVTFRRVLYIFAWSRESTLATEAIYTVASSKDVGIELAAICTAGQRSCCYLFLPKDEDEASRMMIPQTGVKFCAFSNPPDAKLVNNRLAWWLLRKVGRSYLRTWFG